MFTFSQVLLHFSCFFFFISGNTDPKRANNVTLQEDCTRAKVLIQFCLSGRVTCYPRQKVSAHIVDLDLALALVLFLEVSRELVENGSTATPLKTEARWTTDVVDLKTGLLICKCERNVGFNRFC